MGRAEPFQRRGKELQFVVVAAPRPWWATARAFLPMAKVPLSTGAMLITSPLLFMVVIFCMNSLVC
ncbi:hypothetical protein ACKI1I_18895 [Streptomyces turgidiscabies]|uniref:hypothetical protein n=1 Tax=Streptomyces TaxID=1883 RepID=UPI0002FFFF41|nr:MULTISPECIES: hypothetical protein [Streptomyces]MDX3497817.1 hypothetical protein [Streptomyces turgidiscabies]GAQ69721.1 hypothetical protein T45_01452 [Streptomyces turgidiscabies]